MSNKWLRHVAHIHESCLRADTRTSHVTRVKEYLHACMYESCHTLMSGTRRTYTWILSLRTNESCRDSFKPGTEHFLTWTIYGVRASVRSHTSHAHRLSQILSSCRLIKTNHRTLSDMNHTWSSWLSHVLHNRDVTRVQTHSYMEFVTHSYIEFVTHSCRTQQACHTHTDSFEHRVRD